MRINLADDQGKRGRKKRSRRWRIRRTRILDSVISLPEASHRRRSQGRRPAPPQDKRRKAAKSQQEVLDGKRVGAGSRAPLLRRRHTAENGATLSHGVSRSSWWRITALRLAALMALAALIGLIVYASTDAKFFVYRATILGASHLEAEKVYEAAEIHEQSIFWIEPSKVQERVVKLAGVKAARIHMELPSVVTIEVEERQPIVMWRATSQQEDLWLDEDGMVLPYHGDVNSAQMVFVVDYGERNLQVGDYIEPEGIVQSALQLAEAVPGARVFFYHPDRGLSFTQEVAGRQWPVYVGTSEDLSHKIQVMQALTTYLQANGIQPQHVDVRWPEHPTFGRPPAEKSDGGG